MVPAGLSLGAAADAADLASFLGRAVALDPAAVARLRAAGGRVSAYVRLPFGVLVSRTVTGTAEPADVTVGASALLGSLESPGAQPGFVGPGPADTGHAPDLRAAWPGGVRGRGRGMVVPWPVRRDTEWRAALPPAGGWVRLDAVPGDVVRGLVRAGRDALRAVPAGSAGAAGESLLDHESLTVTGAGRTAALPLRVLSALTRMGFLGGEPAADLVVVSATGGWVRLAAAYGSAYQHTGAGLGLSRR